MTTQNCAECGTRAEPGQSFCDGCGAVLGWDRPGSRSTRSAPAAPAADGGAGDGAPRPAPERQDVPAAPAAPASGDRPYTPYPDGAQQPPAGHGAHGASAPPPSDMEDTLPNDPVPPAPAPGPAPGPASGDADADRARSLLVPVSDPEPRPAQAPVVEPVLPGRAEAERPQVRAPGHQQAAVEGPPCSWCSTPNRPDRHFCSRCAMRLADTGENTPERLPWWRRLRGEQGEPPWAGDRPRLRRGFGRIGTWVTAAIVVTLVVLAAVNLPDGIQATRDHFAKRAPVFPDRIKASRSFSGHKPELVIDKLNNTWWGPGVSESGEGQWVEVSFDRPTRLLDLIITPGVSVQADKLNESALPHRVKAEITKADGVTKVTREITLDQGAGPQRRSFRVGEVSKVRFTIESAHAASAKKQVAIAEIEFFGRSNASST